MQIRNPNSEAIENVKILVCFTQSREGVLNNVLKLMPDIGKKIYTSF